MVTDASVNVKAALSGTLQTPKDSGFATAWALALSGTVGSSGTIIEVLITQNGRTMNEPNLSPPPQNTLAPCPQYFEIASALARRICGFDQMEIAGLRDLILDAIKETKTSGLKRGGCKHRRCNKTELPS